MQSLKPVSDGDDASQTSIPRPLRGGIAAWLPLGHDVVMAGVATLAALYLQIGKTGMAADPLWTGEIAAQSVLAAAAAFWITGLHRSEWSFATVRDGAMIAKSAVLASFLFVVLIALTGGLGHFPPIALAVQLCLLLALVSVPRLVSGLLVGERAASASAPPERILLVGAGEATETLLRALKRDGRSRFQPVGIVDEMGNYLRSRMHGVEVLGSLAELPAAVDRLAGEGVRPDRLVVTDGWLDDHDLDTLLKEANSLGLTLGRAPSEAELRNAGGAVIIEPIGDEAFHTRDDVVRLPRKPGASPAPTAQIEGAGDGDGFARHAPV